LVFFSDKHVLPPATENVMTWGYADLSLFEPFLAESLPSISEDRLTWTFTTRSDARFHPWRTASGTLITDQVLTAEDVEYAFKRMLVQDMLGSPSWLINEALTGNQFFTTYDANTATNTIEPVGIDGQGERLVASLIENSITRSGSSVIFHLNITLPDTMFMQILAGSWSSVVNKAFCVEHGCWNGSFYDGWSTDYRRKPSNQYSPLDMHYAAKSKYPSGNPDVPAMCGTGPYKFTYWNKTTTEWRIDRFDNYWRGWIGNHLDTIISRFVPEWTTRKLGFLTGGYDTIAVPRSNMSELLDPSDPSGHTALPGIAMYYDAPSLSIDAMLFCFDVNPESAWVPKVGGVPESHFFANVHVRRAFAHSLNFTLYMRDVWSNEALQPASWWIRGLAPDYENKTLVPYVIDVGTVENELKTAGVWDSGFEVCMPYYRPNYGERIICEAISQTFRDISPRFQVKPVPWDIWLDIMEGDWQPTFFAGWYADIADPDNFVRPYMFSQDGFSIYQHYSNDTIDDLIEAARRMPNGDERNQTYQRLQHIYWSEAIGLPLSQGTSRIWVREWVRGYYYNQLYPGPYFYDLHNEAPQFPVDLSISIANVTQWLIDDHGKADVEVGYPYGTGQAPAINITVEVKRTDTYTQTDQVQTVYAVEYTNGSGFSVIDMRIATLALGETLTDSFTLYDPYMQLGNYTVKALTAVLSSAVFDENLTNNEALGRGFDVKWLLGDINLDRIVELMDFYAAAQAFGSFPGHPRWDIRCDIYGEGGPATSPNYSGDGYVEMMDFYVLSQHFGEHYP
jgi:peptide/nickel transport system substrate-binding protein